MQLNVNVFSDHPLSLGKAMAIVKTCYQSVSIFILEFTSDF